MGHDGLLLVGEGHYVRIARVLAIADARRRGLNGHVVEARRAGSLVDLTGEKPARSALFLDSDHLVLSSVRAETLVGRLRHQLLLREVAQRLYAGS